MLRIVWNDSSNLQGWVAENCSCIFCTSYIHVGRMLRIVWSDSSNLQGWVAENWQERFQYIDSHVKSNPVANRASRLLLYGLRPFSAEACGEISNQKSDNRTLCDKPEWRLKQATPYGKLNHHLDKPVVDE